jgi:hypothetical protein
MTMLSSNLCLRCVSSSEEASAAKGLQYREARLFKKEMVPKREARRRY